jgi:DNA-binding response OmpR family regulator
MQSQALPGLVIRHRSKTQRKSTSVTRRIRFCDFKINLDERMVTLRDHELRLTSEEFDVLVFLASHPQSLVAPTNHVGQKFDCKSAWTNQVFNNVKFPPQEA